MKRSPLASQKYAPCARCTKRGVPPTARNARTGEFTPPGMRARARSNSCWLRSAAPPLLSVLGVMGRQVEQGMFGRRARAGLVLALIALGLGPEHAVGDHVAHAGAEARVE